LFEGSWWNSLKNNVLKCLNKLFFDQNNNKNVGKLICFTQGHAKLEIFFYGPIETIMEIDSYNKTINYRL
jgi:hypothetical protein